MKYLIGFIVGVVLTTIFFNYRIRKNAAEQNKAPAAIENTVEEDEGLPNDFLTFYHHFHDDSLYQLKHILFPLEGLPPQADSVILADKNFRWQQEDWVLHQPFENVNGEFSRTYEKINDRLIIENIRFMNAPFGMQRRFSKSGDEWYLIYYAGMNRLREEG